MTQAKEMATNWKINPVFKAQHQAPHETVFNELALDEQIHGYNYSTTDNAL